MSEEKLEVWFEKFWQTYPTDLCLKKKGPRTRAWAYIEKLNPDQDLRNKIMVNLRELINYYRTEKRVYGKTDRWAFASTWIKEEQWENIRDIQEMPSELKTKLNGDNCACGKKATIQGKCDACWDRGSPDYRERRKAMYRHLQDQGLGMRKGESRSEWNLRCCKHGLAETSLGHFVRSGKEILQRLERQVSNQAQGGDV